MNKSTYLAGGIENFIMDFFCLKYLLLEVLRFFDERRNFLVQSSKNRFLPCKLFNDTVKRYNIHFGGCLLLHKILRLFQSLR